MVEAVAITTTKIKNMNPNIGNEGVKFGSGQDTTKGGRKKKIYNILKEKGYGSDDIVACFNELAFYSRDELQDLLARSDVPVIMTVVARAFQMAVNKGQFSFVKEIVEHVVGKAVQKTEMEVVTKDITNQNLDNLTVEELLDYEKLQMKINGISRDE
jgi:hypothetical protein